MNTGVAAILMGSSFNQVGILPSVLQVLKRFIYGSRTTPKIHTRHRPVQVFKAVTNYIPKTPTTACMALRRTSMIFATDIPCLLQMSQVGIRAPTTQAVRRIISSKAGLLEPVSIYQSLVTSPFQGQAGTPQVSSAMWEVTITTITRCAIRRSGRLGHAEHFFTKMPIPARSLPMATRLASIMTITSLLDKRASGECAAGQRWRLYSRKEIRIWRSSIR
jgi:hypothetical protein